MATMRAFDTLDAGHRVIVGDILPTFISPGAVLARMTEIDSRYRALDREIVASTARQVFKDAWGELKAGWDKFYAENQGWAGRFFSAVALSEELDRWDEKYRFAFDGFKREGGQPTEPTAPPEPNPHSPAGERTRPATPTPGWAWGVIAVASVGAAAYLINAIKS